MRWALVDMDDGIVRWERTKAECLRWASGHCGEIRILPRNRHKVADGFYEYFIGSDPEDCSQYWIAREDVLSRHGFDPDQPALYPDPLDCYRMVDREAQKEAVAKSDR